MRPLEPGVWVSPSGSPTTDMVYVIRLAQSLGGPSLDAADERLVVFFESRDDPFAHLMEIRDEAIDWLSENKCPDGFEWGYEPDTSPPAAFGLWQVEEQP